MIKLRYKIVITFLAFAPLLAGCSRTQITINSEQQKPETDNKKAMLISTATKEAGAAIENEEKKPVLNLPIERAEKRILKKPFGIFITPENSPVEDEKFTGYHTGVDFEIFEEEEELKVFVYTICSGPLKIKRRVNGYGGVIIQDCVINGEPVTILYGHIDLNGVKQSVGGFINKSEPIAFLGKGYSSETDGERKHLHLGIHKGSGIEYRGYVPKESELADWLDFTKIEL